MITLKGQVKCDIPGCDNVCDCVVYLRFRVGDFVGFLGNAEPIEKVVVLDPAKEPWKSVGLLNDGLACPKHTEEEIEAIAEMWREKGRPK